MYKMTNFLLTIVANTDITVDMKLKSVKKAWISVDLPGFLGIEKNGHAAIEKHMFDRLIAGEAAGRE